MESIHILWVQRSITPYGNGTIVLKRPYYHMYIVFAGAIEVCVEETPYTLRPGMMDLVLKNQPKSHVVISEEDADYVEIKFAITSPGLERRVQNHGGPLLSEDSVITSLTKKILDEYASPVVTTDEAAESYLKSILEIVLRDEKNPIRDSFLELSDASDLTRRVADYVNSHYMGRFSLDEMAESLSFNKSYLCTAFKKENEITIMDYLNLFRIRQAAKLLSYSDRPVDQVAKAVGLGSASQLNHVFQHYVGVTPTYVRTAFSKNVALSLNTRKDDPKRLVFNVLAGQPVPYEKYTFTTGSRRKTKEEN
jgi:AraC-like DNA-binding protein